MAAVAVVVIAGGAAVALRGEPRQHPISAIRPTPTLTPTPARITGAEPMEKVWPAAVTLIPSKLPGGAKIRPLKLIDDRNLLFQTWASHERANAIYAYDLEARTSRKITDIRTPEGAFASNWTIVGDRVFWSTIEDGGTGLWSVPLEGGVRSAWPPCRDASTRWPRQVTGWRSPRSTAVASSPSLSGAGR